MPNTERERGGEENDGEKELLVSMIFSFLFADSF